MKYWWSIGRRIIMEVQSHVVLVFSVYACLRVYYSYAYWRVRFALRQRRYFAGALTARPLIAFGRLAAVCRRCADERRYYYYIYIHVVYTYTYLSHIVWARARGRKWERERGWKLKKLLRHFGGTGRSCARGDRHEVRRKEVIIKTRWDRERGQSISSRTDARTFSFNPTGHHLSENFSIRFKERPECACWLLGLLPKTPYFGPSSAHPAIPYSCLRLSITYIDSRMAFSIPLYLYVLPSLSLSLSSLSLFLSSCLHWCRYIIQLSTYESPQTSPRGVSRYHGGGEIRQEKKLSGVKIGWKFMPGPFVLGIQYTERLPSTLTAFLFFNGPVIQNLIYWNF